MGHADVPLVVSGDFAAGTRFEVRLLLQGKGLGKARDWTAGPLLEKGGRGAGAGWWRRGSLGVGSRGAYRLG